MTSKLLIGLIGGGILGAAFGAVAGNTIIGILVCAAASAVAGYVWERAERRTDGRR